MIDTIKAELEAINIDIKETQFSVHDMVKRHNDLNDKVESLEESVKGLMRSLSELTIAIAAGLPIK